MRIFPTIRDRLTELAIGYGALVPSVAVEGTIYACKSGRRSPEEVMEAFWKTRPDLFSDHTAQRTAKKAAKKAARVDR